ncbi:hypothetical protein PtB15_14B456 [Puccinia triticina]|nr:hypothetical protein PtB15_14B456 [Puccinia triticina]
MRAPARTGDETCSSHPSSSSPPGWRDSLAERPAATTSSVQTVALTLGLRAQASGAALVLKTLYASDLHIDPRDYSYRFSLRLPPAKHLVAGAAPYELVLSQYLLLGATQSPMLYSNSTLVTLQK